MFLVLFVDEELLGLEDGWEEIFWIEGKLVWYIFVGKIGEEEAKVC